MPARILDIIKLIRMQSSSNLLLLNEYLLWQVLYSFIYLTCSRSLKINGHIASERDPALCSNRENRDCDDKLSTKVQKHKKTGIYGEDNNENITPAGLGLRPFTAFTAHGRRTGIVPPRVAGQSAGSSHSGRPPFILRNHPDGNAAPPLFGLRLDGLLTGDTNDI